ncbi:MAG: hypothetical protein IJ782_07195 [Prevotella sp.]|nr:hypothetical protein [Prevotella sp.]
MQNTSNNEPKLTYARNQNGEIVFIDTVPNGSNCNCSCVGCGKPLIARQGEKNQHHFAHEGGNVRECYDKTLHSLAEQIIKENKQVYSPKYDGEYYKHESELLSFVEVEVEQRNDYSDLQPDLVGVTEDGKRIHIEIRNTHKVDSSKESKLKDRKQICMEIDVSKQSLNELKDFLLTKDEERKWISHPEFEEEERKAKEEAYKLEKEKIRWISELAAKTSAYGFDDDEVNSYQKPVSQTKIKPIIEETIEPKSVEPPTIVHNEALDPLLAKLRKERVIRDNSGNILYVEFCEQTYRGKYIVARVFDNDYATSKDPAHVVLINEQGYIVHDFPRETGEQIYSRNYEYARKKY